MSATAGHRRSVLAFWEKRGLQAAIDHAEVSRATLYAWRAAYQRRGVAGLTDMSRAPRRVRRRTWPPELVEEIRRQCRELPHLGPASCI